MNNHQKYQIDETDKQSLCFLRLENDAPSSLITLLKPMGILLKEALDQTDQHDNSYQVIIHFNLLFFYCHSRPLALNI